MGQRVALSEIDIRKINKLYACPQTKSTTSIDNGTTSQSKPTTTTMTTTTTNTASECRDLNWRCPFWSMSVFSYCDKYPEIAYQTCVKSCACHDLNPSCETWASRGECENPFQRRFMSALCPQSCRVCTTIGNPSIALRCDDIESYFTCKIALIFNECGEKIELCAKTCGAC
ncbi:unnamed protein product [Toxocara canis]|uniref:ShKT domain-containing protein n=1 Tax=Toxocara canis TaxID=6265 RepID=A0A183US87_TOXCA|nr:unnamed protein product [Toxocara canis]